jgi:hypothetical protein
MLRLPRPLPEVTVSALGCLRLPASEFKLYSILDWLSKVNKVEVMLLPTVSWPVCLGVKTHLGTKIRFLLLSDSCGFLDVGALFLTRGRLCRLQLLLYLASAVILVSESRETYDHFFLPQIRDSPNLEVTVFISRRNRVAQLYPQALGSLFIASYDSQGYGGGIWSCLHTGSDLAVFRFSIYSICTDPQFLCCRMTLLSGRTA